MTRGADTYRNRASALTRLVPAGLDARTSTVPEPDGATTDNSVSDTTSSFDPAREPNMTFVTPDKSVPVNVTTVPPAVRPNPGATPVTAGTPTATATDGGTTAVTTDNDNTTAKTTPNQPRTRPTTTTTPQEDQVWRQVLALDACQTKHKVDRTGSLQEGCSERAPLWRDLVGVLPQANR